MKRTNIPLLLCLFLLISASGMAQGVIKRNAAVTTTTQKTGKSPAKKPTPASSKARTSSPSPSRQTSVKQKPSPYVNGHEYVDLGLSVKWATCNVGASQPQEYGDYYAWGETQTKSDYSWKTYKLGRGNQDSMKKYNCTFKTYGPVDNKRTLDPEDDVAHVKWGGTWRMPTDEEQTELRDNCIWTYTSIDGVNGYEVKSKKNGKSIFLPTAGHYWDKNYYVAGSFAYYWSSTVCDLPNNAWNIDFSSTGINRYQGSRHLGQSVRPVCP